MSQEPKGHSNAPAPPSSGMSSSTSSGKPAQPNAVRGNASGSGTAHDPTKSDELRHDELLHVDARHDELRLLVNSRHPIITVETAEEERFEQLLLEVAAELCVPIYEWSVTGASGSMARRGDLQYGSARTGAGKHCLDSGRRDFFPQGFCALLRKRQNLPSIAGSGGEIQTARRAIVISAPSLQFRRSWHPRQRHFN